MRVGAIALTTLLLCVSEGALAEQSVIKPTEDYCRTTNGASDLEKKAVPDLKLVLSSKDLQFCSFSGEGLSEINKGWAKKMKFWRFRLS